ncbi:hypothetical protein KC335_g17777 [Hortaea werneckii]|nr:hypothetical protein KC335_g17777 [Hortaea werneckii]
MPDDFYKIEELVRILVERVVGAASRKTDVASVEEGLRNVGLETARQWQMEGLEEVYEDAWGPHLGAVREQLSRESALFMKEQRVRCLLQGAWFPTASVAGASAAGVGGGGWRYVRLSHNRRYLHYRNFGEKTEGSELPLDQLPEKIDLNTVTSVESNISAAEQQQQQQQRQSQQTNGVLGGQANSSVETLRTGTARDSTKHSQLQQPTTTSKITIIGTVPPPGRSGATSALSLVSPGADEETVLLELQPQSISEASEWLDGLLMLLDQQPITASTTQLIDMMVDWGVRLRMLNLRWEDVDWEALEQRVKGLEVEEREVPSREGLAGEEYWYAQTVS